jgi:hypothetical protein
MPIKWEIGNWVQYMKPMYKFPLKIEISYEQMFRALVIRVKPYPA